jgi:hypothetical protein
MEVEPTSDKAFCLSAGQIPAAGVIEVPGAINEGQALEALAFSLADEMN